MFNAYIGIDPKTGKKRRTTRRRFETKKETKLALARLELGDDKPQFKHSEKKEAVTFYEIHKRWFGPYKETVSEGTMNGTEIYFRCHILPILGSKNIASITFEQAQNVVILWSKK
ncbi:MAG: N-terminal phage integrase SAM-like domain-containing protein [Lactococcus lactis]|nr:N-terminal phage integrase SAM-like domain-containing protein [Lactococcus lactis]